MAQERRYLPQLLSEARAISSEDGTSHIAGKGIVFNQPSQKLGWFVEIIKDGALNGANIEDMLSFFNHDANFTLGSLRNKTVSLTITDRSADYDILAPDGPMIKELVLAPIQRGDVTGSSFMFDVARKGDEWEEGPDGMYIRTIHAIETVYEMGPVSMPAYRQTSTTIDKRSIDDIIKLTKQQDHFMRSIARERLKVYM